MGCMHRTGCYCTWPEMPEARNSAFTIITIAVLLLLLLLLLLLRIVSSP